MFFHEEGSENPAYSGQQNQNHTNDGVLSLSRAALAPAYVGDTGGAGDKANPLQESRPWFTGEKVPGHKHEYRCGACDNSRSG